MREREKAFRLCRLWRLNYLTLPIDLAFAVCAVFRVPSPRYFVLNQSVFHVPWPSTRQSSRPSLKFTRTAVSSARRRCITPRAFVKRPTSKVVVPFFQRNTHSLFRRPAAERPKNANENWVRASVFSVAAPHTWNSLPSDVRSCRTVDTFKRHLKTHLFRRS